MNAFCLPRVLCALVCALLIGGLPAFDRIAVFYWAPAAEIVSAEHPIAKGTAPKPEPGKIAPAKPKAAKSAKPSKESEIQSAVKRFEGEGRDVFQKRYEILGVCQLKPGMDVADIGAGTGLFTRLFAPQVLPGGKVYAIDVSKQYVDYIVDTCRKQKIDNVVGITCTPDAVGLPPGSIDLAFVCDTYHHFNHPEKNLASIHQALRPGGRLIIVEFKKEKGATPDWVMKHVRPDRQMLIKEVTDAGFTLLDEPPLMKMQQVYRFQKK